MVTFTSDYWAPGLENNVRRRPDLADPTASDLPRIDTNLARARGVTGEDLEQALSGIRTTTLSSPPASPAHALSPRLGLPSPSSNGTMSPPGVKRPGLISRLFGGGGSSTSASSANGDDNGPRSANSQPSGGDVSDEEDPFGDGPQRLPAPPPAGRKSPKRRLASLRRGLQKTAGSAMGRDTSNQAGASAFAHDASSADHGGSALGDASGAGAAGDVDGNVGADTLGDERPGDAAASMSTTTCINGIEVVSLRKKYGVVCDSSETIGKGATAVVRIAHRLMPAGPGSSLFEEEDEEDEDEEDSPQASSQDPPSPSTGLLSSSHHEGGVPIGVVGATWVGAKQGSSPPLGRTPGTGTTTSSSPSHPLPPSSSLPVGGTALGRSVSGHGKERGLAARQLEYGVSGGPRLYAIKEFRKRRKDESEKAYIKKLTGEFCISSALKHKNIVETVDLVLDEDHQWCEVMEYCPGGDLYNVIRNGRMTPMEVDCCFSQLICGVAYLHSQGVAHRDLKPENLLVDAHGRLKITDFGVSDVFRMGWEQDAHASRGLCGSEPYIAPEQFEGHEYDARAVDVWACGIVYYAMTYKGIPFRMASRADSHYTSFLEKRAAGRYAPFNKLPTGAKVLMLRILEPSVNRRITIDGILQDVWYGAIDTCRDFKGIVSGKPHAHYANGYVPPPMPRRKGRGRASTAGPI